MEKIEFKNVAGSFTELVVPHFVAKMQVPECERIVARHALLGQCGDYNYYKCRKSREDLIIEFMEFFNNILSDIIKKIRGSIKQRSQTITVALENGFNAVIQDRYVNVVDKEIILLYQKKIYEMFGIESNTVTIRELVLEIIKSYLNRK
jgi:hypothetical protein